MFDSLAPRDEEQAYYANPADIINHLLIVWTIDYVENSPGRYTKPGEPASV